MSNTYDTWVDMRNSIDVAIVNTAEDGTSNYAAIHDVAYVISLQ